MTRGCEREPEVLDAVLSDAWGGAAGQGLRAHLESCERCRETARLAGAVREDATALAASARVPSAGAVWWRLQIRQRHEAAQAADRPIRVAELVALASLAGAVVALVALGLAWLGGVPAAGGTAAGAVTRAATQLQSSLPLAATVLLVAAALPVLVYLVLSRE